MAERIECAGDGPKLLDADTLIDEIIAKKGPQKYTEGFSQDNWEQEFEQIPLFMTKSPDAIDPEKAPGLAALQDLKYELSTAEGRANAHKEEGNQCFRLKQYHRAVEEYSAGLKEGGDDVTLCAVLYTNRAASQYYLGNLRSCLNDVTEAKKLKPNHLKAYQRGALACVKLERYGEAVEWCDQGLRVDPEDAKLRDLRSKALKEKKHQERNQRKQAMAEKSKEAEKKKLLEAIRARGIQLASSVSLKDDEESLSMGFTLDGSHPSGEKVHFEPDGRLVWPVLFLYPEHGQTDLISAFHEDHRFVDHLNAMFGEGERPAWDQEGVYTPDTIQIYFEDSLGNGFIKVDANKTLGEVLITKGYTVGSGTPAFLLLSSTSSFTQHFLQRSS